MAINNPHDRFFRQTFSDLMLARSFLQHYLPPEVLALLDLDGLTLRQESYVDEELQDHQSDLLFEVPFAAPPAGSALRMDRMLLYFLVEHKSYPDEEVLLQMQRYRQKIWDDQRRQNEPLRLIVPLIVYHGRTRWTVPATLADWLQVPPALRPFTPTDRYLLYDFSREGSEQIVGDDLLRAILLMLRHVFGRDLATWLVEIVQLLGQESSTVRRYSFLRVVLRYSVEGGRIEQDQMRAAVTTALPEGEETMATWIDDLIEQGHEQGLEKGREEGREEGREKGREEGREEGVELARKLLLDILRYRFDAVPAAVEQQLSNQLYDQLPRLTNLALSASTLDEFARNLTQ